MLNEKKNLLMKEEKVIWKTSDLICF